MIKTFLFIGFTTWFARLAERLVPERAVPEGVIIAPEFLDEGALKVPSLALENVRREIHRTGTVTMEMMGYLDIAFRTKSSDKLDDVVRGDDKVNILEAEIMAYLGRIRQSMLSEDEGSEHQALMTAMMDLRSLSSVMATDIVPLSRIYFEGEFEASSEETREMVEGLWDTVRRSVELAVEAVGQNDQRAAQDVRLLKDDIRDLSDRFFDRHAQRLRADDPKYLQRVRLLMTFIEQLRHMYTLAKRISRTQLPAEVAREAD